MSSKTPLEDKIDQTIDKVFDQNNPYIEIYKNKLEILTRYYNEASREIARLNEEKDQILHLVKEEPIIPDWLEKPEQEIIAQTPILLVSDFHYGENINPDEVPDGNCYSPSVANARWDRLILRTEEKIGNKKPNGIIVCFLGDDVSGDIHNELRETNYKTPIDACMDVAGQKIKMLTEFQQKYVKVWAISVMGNHGRTTQKPQSKGIYEHNYDSLVAAMVERQLKDNKNIQFYTPKSGEAYFDIYGINFLATHGDRIGSRGGQGFIGCSATIARGQHKTRQAYSQIGKPVDWLLIGHFHTPMQLEHTIANGTTVGYSQYARDLRLEPAFPSQTLFWVDEKYGVNNVERIYVSDPKSIIKDRQLYFKGNNKIINQFTIKTGRDY